MKGTLLAATLAAVVTTTSSASAFLPCSQRASPPIEQSPFLARTDGVLVDVAVTRGNHPVSGLVASDFTVLDNQVRQDFQVLDAATPINAVLALDMSASAAGARRSDLLAASRALLDNLSPGDRAGLTAFNDGIATTLPPTTDVASVKHALATLVPAGGTALLDGIYTALLTTHRTLGPSLVVVCTDGVDTASWLQFAEVRDTAMRSNAVVITVLAGPGHRDQKELTDLAQSTGGLVVESARTGELSAAFQGILRDFRSRYVITFVPHGVESGGFHRLDVRVRNTNLTVHARAGYFSESR